MFLLIFVNLTCVSTHMGAGKMFGAKKPTLKRYTPDHGGVFNNRCDVRTASKVKQAARPHFEMTPTGLKIVRGAQAKNKVAGVPRSAGAPKSITEYNTPKYSEGRAVNVPESEPCAHCYLSFASHAPNNNACLSARKGGKPCDITKYVKKVFPHKRKTYAVMA